MHFQIDDDSPGREGNFNDVLEGEFFEVARHLFYMDGDKDIYEIESCYTCSGEVSLCQVARANIDVWIKDDPKVIIYSHTRLVLA